MLSIERARSSDSAINRYGHAFSLNPSLTLTETSPNNLLASWFSAAEHLIILPITFPKKGKIGTGSNVQDFWTQFGLFEEGIYLSLFQGWHHCMKSDTGHLLGDFKHLRGTRILQADDQDNKFEESCPVQIQVAFPVHLALNLAITVCYSLWGEIMWCQVLKESKNSKQKKMLEIRKKSRYNHHQFSLHQQYLVYFSLPFFNAKYMVLSCLQTFSGLSLKKPSHSLCEDLISSIQSGPFQSSFPIS